MTPPRRRKSKNVEIVWSHRAEADLLEIGDFIAVDNPAAARKTVMKLITAVERASQMPLSGRMVPEYQRTDLREMISGNYRVVYLAQKKAIYVVTIFEGHRLFPDDALSE